MKTHLAYGGEHIQVVWNSTIEVFHLYIPSMRIMMMIIMMIMMLVIMRIIMMIMMMIMMTARWRWWADHPSNTFGLSSINRVLTHGHSPVDDHDEDEDDDEDNDDDMVTLLKDDGDKDTCPLIFELKNST